MSSFATAQDTAALKHLVDEAMRQSDVDFANLRRATLAAPMDKPLPPAVFKLLKVAHRNTLVAFGKVLSVEAPEAPKSYALTWLSQAATGIASSYRAKATPRAAVTTRKQHLERARECYKRAGVAFAALDKELGCPYGCETP